MGSKRNRNTEKKAKKKAGLHQSVALEGLGSSNVCVETPLPGSESQVDLIQGLVDAEMKKHIHVDDFIDMHYGEEKYARWILNFFRMPAALKFDFEEFMLPHKLFATHEGDRYRVTGASRMGDVWITKDFDQIHGYQKRVFVEELSAWGPEA